MLCSLFYNLVYVNYYFLTSTNKNQPLNHISMKTKIFTLVIALFAVNVLFAQKKQKDKVLANKVYVVEFTETTAKKPKPVEDEISFKTEKLNSKFINLEMKFPAAPYIVEVDSSV